MTNPEIYKDVDVELDALFNNNLESKSDMAHSAIQKALYDEKIAYARKFIDEQKNDKGNLGYLSAIIKILKDNEDFPLSTEDLICLYDLEGTMHLTEQEEYEYEIEPESTFIKKLFINPIK